MPDLIKPVSPGEAFFHKHLITVDKERVARAWIGKAMRAAELPVSEGFIALKLWKQTYKRRPTNGA